MKRVLIVCDEDGTWYARGVRVVEHDLDRDERVYRCDVAIGDKFISAEAAIRAALSFQKEN